MNKIQTNNAFAAIEDPIYFQVQYNKIFSLFVSRFDWKCDFFK